MLAWQCYELKLPPLSGNGLASSSALGGNVLAPLIACLSKKNSPVPSSISLTLAGGQVLAVLVRLGALCLRYFRARRRVYLLALYGRKIGENMEAQSAISSQ